MASKGSKILQSLRLGISKLLGSSPGEAKIVEGATPVPEKTDTPFKTNDDQKPPIHHNPFNVQISTDIPERPLIVSLSDVKAPGTNASMKNVSVAPNGSPKLKAANTSAPLNFKIDQDIPERPLNEHVQDTKDNTTNLSAHDINITTDAVSTFPNTDQDKEIDTEPKSH